MSSLTICNYCELGQIIKDAKQEHKSVVTKKNIQYGGIDVYVKDPGEELDTNTENNKHWKAWFMKLSLNCRCSE